jgi:hypothetical protein
MALKVFQKFLDGAAQGFFVKLGKLPAQRHLPFSCPKVSELFQELDDTMRTLVQHDGARHLDEGSETFLASFFVWEKPLEVKPVTGQP